jgi:hypothetical protein
MASLLKQYEIYRSVDRLRTVLNVNIKLNDTSVQR